MRIDPGEVIAGRYEVERELARGGMGVVLVAQHVETEQRVALKILFADPTGSEEIERFRLEARVFSRLASEHIVRVLDAGVDADRKCAYIVMELLEGETLYARVARDGGLPAAVVLDVLEQVALGLERAHGLRDAEGEPSPIVHRDLKPENIFLSPRPKGRTHVTILDFGIAKQASAGAQVSTEIRGTPAYLAWEQIEGKAVTPATDVSALGLIAFFSLTGKVYWKAANDPSGHLATLIREILRGPIESASERACDLGATATLPDSFDRWFAKATAIDPTTRFPTARGAVHALAGALDVEARTKAPSASPALSETLPAPATQPVTRNRRWSVIGVAAVAVALGAAGLRATRSPALPAPAVPASSGVAITDHPAPKSNVAAANASYTFALRALRDGDEATGAHAMLRAARADRAFASAQVRIPLYAWPPWGVGQDEWRVAAASAAKFRETLDDKDRTYLAASEEALSDRFEFPKILEAYRDALKKHPDDAELALVSGHAFLFGGDIAEARRLMVRARELDPAFALAWAWQAALEHELDVGKMKPLVDECVARFPRATSCLDLRMIMLADEGRCSELEGDARRLVQLAPEEPDSYRALAYALAARNAPVESVRVALDRMVTLGGDLSPSYGRPVEDAWLALLTGDLTATEAALQRTQVSFDNDTSEGVHDEIAHSLAAVAMERGESAAAAARFTDPLETASAARTHDSESGWSVKKLYARHRAKAISDAEFVAERDRRWQAAAAYLPLPAGSLQNSAVWLDIFAIPVQTPDEAKDTLARLASYGPIRDPAGILGRIYLLAGQPGAAVPVLRRAAAACDVLPGILTELQPVTLRWLERHRELGEALEATNDRAGACDAYAVVLERWKNAKPRSITLEKAKERTQALGCGTAR